ncbi:CaiB/BaiF CoA transferase family protein [Oceanibaculum pacificum]|uniref:Acyl-CoA hydratase n=1 Tax=Oceanibaculum pacificum TaxID=580166 RepID=A0A154VWB4_9PROT|nr:CaiB/BaiF CoA-transferase family protein [Oceanibaculum pacificum]KZD05489.1 acyl-CoA hydratase [Oceanibaculum pacificum]
MQPSLSALAGLKILDLTRLLPGAFCSQILADHGAEVVKIEQPGEGDYNRSFEPLNKEESGSFLLLNRNKKSVTLNLKSAEGKEIFLKLVDQADVVIEGFRPGVMQRLGLDYDALSKRNPKLIMCAISGFGQDGPYRLVSGHDLNYMGFAGALQLYGTREKGPGVPGLATADMGGGSLMAVIGILMAVVARQTTGRGQFVDISMMDGAFAWLSYYAADWLFAKKEPYGGENPFLGGAACYNVFRCRDGKFLTLGVIEPHFWARFCDVAGQPDLKDRQWPTEAGRQALYDEVQAIFLTDTRDSWVKRLIDADVPAGPVNSMEEAFADPQIRHRQMVLEVDHPVEGRIPQLGFPVKLSDTPGRIDAPSPLLGQHNAEMLARIGYSQADVERLKAEGAM